MSKLDDKRFAKATWQIMEQLLEVESLDEALSGSLDIIIKVLKSEAGILWFVDKKTGRLFPMFHVGPQDISGVSVEVGMGIEGIVTETGKSIRIEDAQNDPRFEGTVFDDNEFMTKTMLCVPLMDHKDIIGCVQIINKEDGSFYDEEELELCERMASLAALTIEDKGLIVDTGEEKTVLISLKNVIKEFPSGEGVSRVLKGINLDIYENEFVVILGESGCGKSTLMNIIGGMDFLTEGQLLIEGKDYSHPTDEEMTMFRRQYVGFIFQSYNLMPNLTALENVEFIAEIAKDPIESLNALAQVGMDKKSGNYPAQLSGGQQQRVAIARALVKNPKVILADEPTAALDFQTGQEVLMVIENIVKNRGTTVIMVTHNAEIAKMANRVIKLRSGKISSIKWNLNPLPAEEIIW